MTSDLSGTLSLQSNGVAVTMPAVAGTMMVSGNMPAFSAYPSATFTASSATWTKIPANTKEFDTNSNYDNATNYRFTPTVSGYYQVSGCWSLASGTSTRSLCAIYKNGTLFKQGLDTPTTGTTGSNISTLINLNGSTDYVEFYLYITGTGTQTVNAGAGSTWFQACLVRGA